MKRIYEFSFIPKHLAYMIKDKTERYWYLYIRKKEVGIITETDKGFYIYDYSEKRNIDAGNKISTLSTKIKKLYRLYNNVPRETTN